MIRHVVPEKERLAVEMRAKRVRVDVQKTSLHV
jgi:hypothetical protein